MNGSVMRRSRRDGLEVSLDDPLVCRQKETKKSDQRTTKRNICKPIYPSWQQPRTEIVMARYKVQKGPMCQTCVPVSLCRKIFWGKAHRWHVFFVAYDFIYEVFNVHSFCVIYGLKIV